MFIFMWKFDTRLLRSTHVSFIVLMRAYLLVSVRKPFVLSLCVASSTMSSISPFNKCLSAFFYILLFGF